MSDDVEIVVARFWAKISRGTYADNVHDCMAKGRRWDQKRNAV